MKKLIILLFVLIWTFSVSGCDISTAGTDMGSTHDSDCFAR